MICLYGNRFAVAVFSAGLMILSGLAARAMAEPFSPPALDGFVRHAERMADGDGDGVKETQIVQYLNPGGDSIVSMSSGGRVWAWSQDARDSDAGNRNYVIRDSDCDGTFEEIYGLDEKFYVPACLK
jgi:hypothetical protein